MPRVPCSTGRVAKGMGRVSPTAEPCASTSAPKERAAVLVMTFAKTLLGMDDYWRADVGPVEQYLGVGVGHADAAVAAGGAETGAPISTVNGVVAPEGHDPV